MKTPLWKVYLSYLTEIHMERTSSVYNPELTVSLNKGRYQLSTANAVYSYGDLYDNFTKTFKHFQAKLKPAQDVLILGLGLGSIPFMLENKFQLKNQYTAVEIDEQVISLAEKYVLSELTSPVNTVCEDAFAYIMQCQKQFDWVCMDVFLDDIVPSKFNHLDFLNQLKSLIRPNGTLLYNRLALTEKDQLLSSDFYTQQFKKVFPKGDYLDVGGNWMLYDEGNN